MSTDITAQEAQSGSNGAPPRHVSLGGSRHAFPQSTDIPVDRSILGLLFFLGTEAMFFAGLISTFLILKAGADTWPPAGQPRLPVGITAINTALLLLSGFTMSRAFRTIGKGDASRLSTWLGLTAVLGALFLGIQGYEWVRLLGFGLAASSNVYGGTFYTLIGAHGLHVLVGLAVLVFVFLRSTRKWYTQQDTTGVELCKMYWYFVVGVWPVLYILVYLT